MTKRDKKRVKKGLFIFLIIYLLFRLTKKTSIKEKVSTGDNSLLPLDTNKFKEPVSLPKVEKPKFDKVFAKGGSAVRNEKAFAHKVEDMMNAERRKGKIPVKSDVVKQVQREQAPDVSPAEPCVECEEKKKAVPTPPKPVEVPKPVPIDVPKSCNVLTPVPAVYDFGCGNETGALLIEKANVLVYDYGSHRRIINRNGDVIRIDVQGRSGDDALYLNHNEYVDLAEQFRTYDGEFSINERGVLV
ncbi:hypothetical protein EQP59_04125 [Ornithobacterium rhinotracheale]|uniref:Uncharacterized protein n=1 Tax=Ornithobacterium rhinotracheale TaxID=28251 RepID=A0A3R5WZA0_ORNRH|nr:hypothetical protein [Ornithobacterium rhinotracheale]QAR30593.1 hypothetical protein EQP59_04125 [Ornithobacterium rhinotracheale]